MPEIHLPVCLDRTVELLTPAIDGKEHPIVVDATLGLAGHSFELLSRFPHLTIIGIDRDADAIASAARRLEGFHGRVHIYQDTYDHLGRVLDQFGTSTVDGILLDLGVSSLQLDTVERGFSYSQESDLDMRMDRSQGVTAAEILATYSEHELTRILREYGEERFAPRIARAIVAERSSTPIATSSKLVELIKRVIPAPARRTGGNPAKRTFQALRIEVNGELDILDRTLPIALDRLAVGGRMVVLSFHSLEDKIVKRAFARATARKDLPGLPVQLDQGQEKFALVFNGSEKAGAEEILVNPRATSVRLRAITRVAA